MSNVSNEGAAPNANRLLLAGFMAILAAGVGFSIRGGILGDWGSQFGFTQTELGQITGGGLVGFGVIILIGSLLADVVGYGRLMIFAFICHLLSAVITLAATPLFESGGKAAAYQCLYWGMFLFAIGNGTAEAVVNPLTATLYPKEKTHYLNILHAGWPGGLIIGGLASFLLVGKVRWEIQMSLFLIPVVFYGVLCLKQSFPKSEAKVHGVAYRDMLSELGMGGAFVICALLALWFSGVFGSFGMPVGVGYGAAFALLIVFGFVTGFHTGPLLLAFLLVIHAAVGYVELGTDSWISNITGNILASPQKGLLLFVYTSALMFVLRFFAGPIVHRISPLGLLFVSGIFGFIGLFMLGSVTTGILLVVAATIYGIGKTFYWPTMLGVVSEQFPKGGAITIGAIGGVGMLSAGLLGGPGIGYKQDRFASEDLRTRSVAVYEEFRSGSQNSFLFFEQIQGLDGSKVGAIRSMAPEARSANEQMVHEADLFGGRKALRATSLVPLGMAIAYLALILYFRARGGYKAVHIEGEGKAAQETA